MWPLAHTQRRVLERHSAIFLGDISLYARPRALPGHPRDEVRSEQFADTRFESLRMDLGSHSSRTTGKGDGAAPRSPNEFAAKDPPPMARRVGLRPGQRVG